MTHSDLEELHAAVQARLEVVADRALYERDPAAHLERLIAVSEVVNRLTRALPPETDPALRHYLERQSYVKALGWLKERVL